MKNCLAMLIVLSLFMLSYDLEVYLGNLVPIPFISFFTATALTVLYLVMRGVFQKRIFKHITLEARTILLFFIILQFSFLGLLISGPTPNKILQFLKTDIHFSLYIVFIFVIIELLDQRLLQKLLRFYSLCGIGAASLGILQFIHLNVWPIYGMDRFLFKSVPLYYGGIYRVASIFMEPSWFGYFLLDWIAIGVAYYLSRRRKTELINISILLIALLMTASMGPYVSFLAFIFLLLVAIKFRRKVRNRLLSALIIFDSIIFICLILQSPSFHKTTVDRFIQVIGRTDASTVTRINSSSQAVQIWLNSPLIGVGIGNARFYMPESMFATYAIGKRVGIDSVYSAVLAENGLVGFIALLMMIAMIIKQPRSHILQRESHREKNDRTMSHQELEIFTSIFRIIVIRNFFELFIVGAFLFPRLWFDIGLYLFLKDLQRFSGRAMRSRRTSPYEKQ